MKKIKVIVKVILFSGKKKRNIPIKNGYRPLFNILESTKSSGYFYSIESGLIYAGKIGVAEIHFIYSLELLNQIKSGNSFSFSEANEILGEVNIIKILE